MDEDVQEMSREQLVAEVKRLRQGIRQHCDSTEHELCWYHPALWALRQDATDSLPTVPDWPQFFQGCIRYRSIQWNLSFLTKGGALFLRDGSHPERRRQRVEGMYPGTSSRPR
jgi:hypothetical protein